MTAARHAKFLRDCSGRCAALALALGLCASAVAATTERVVTDWRTGLAINGFDPVAYFTLRAPTAGRPELEFAFAGAVWRFRNTGNRAAFAARPEIYMPRFGGYDPVALARSVAAPGHPQLWAIVRDRLYLFHEREAREAFVANPDAAIAAAEAQWAEVARSLVP